MHIACLRHRIDHSTYLRYPSDVLIAVLLCEAQVLVQSKANIVAVETVGRETEVQKVLLKSSRDG